jgi:hypothetical protein
MCFMDKRALIILGQWKEAAHSSQTVHQFRTHSEEEDASFKRSLLRRESSWPWASELNASKFRLTKG